MKKCRKILWAILSLVLVLYGCGSRNAPEETPAGRVVTGITVRYENGPLQQLRHYTAENKMRAILNYLRWIDPYGTPAEDPAAAEGSLFCITMIFSDGHTKEYVQKADRYMQVDGKDWKYIDPVNAMTLGKMVGEMESDA